jgi:hypothetical protein
MALNLGKLSRVAGAVEPTRSSGMPAAQKLWHVSKTHLLELSKEGLWRGATLQPATLADLRTRHALAVRVKAMPIFEAKAAIMPWPELPGWSNPKNIP